MKNFLRVRQPLATFNLSIYLIFAAGAALHLLSTKLKRPVLNQGLPTTRQRVQMKVGQCYQD